MEEDGPEKRVAEFERQLAEPRAGGKPGAASTTGGCLMEGTATTKTRWTRFLNSLSN
jgi:hypothetical protein